MDGFPVSSFSRLWSWCRGFCSRNHTDESNSTWIRFALSNRFAWRIDYSQLYSIRRQLFGWRILVAVEADFSEPLHWDYDHGSLIRHHHPTRRSAQYPPYQFPSLCDMPESDRLSIVFSPETMYVKVTVFLNKVYSWVLLLIYSIIQSVKTVPEMTYNVLEARNCIFIVHTLASIFIKMINYDNTMITEAKRTPVNLAVHMKMPNTRLSCSIMQRSMLTKMNAIIPVADRRSRVCVRTICIVCAWPCWLVCRFYP